LLPEYSVHGLRHETVGGENGVRLFHAAAELRVEGIVAKRADSPYRRGRTSDWVKIKTPAGKEIDAERAKWNERGKPEAASE
jgi:bifunctional non-homologous end joining protein LigD